MLTWSTIQGKAPVDKNDMVVWDDAGRWIVCSKTSDMPIGEEVCTFTDRPARGEANYKSHPLVK